MRLKSFYARTMTEAMQMVRNTLGEDAIIVATREERGGRAVHVTAAVEPAFELGRAAAEASDWLQYDAEEDESAVAEELTDALLRHGATEEVMDQVISCATVVGMENPAEALVASIEHLFAFRPVPHKAVKKPIMVTGAPGAGKTLAIAKIAARSVMNSLKVGVITCDTFRAGGIEQLEAFTKLLRIPLQKSANENDLRAIIADLRDYDQVLIDTAGINPFNKEDVKNLAKLIAAAETEPYLVLPAGGDSEESGEMARVFSNIGVHSLLPTRLDVARRLGGLLSAAHQGKLIFADASNTPKVADGLIALDPRALSELLMPGAFRAKKPKAKTGTAQ